MSRNLKIFLGVSYLFILFVFLYFIFGAIEVSRLDDFSYYKEVQSNLDSYTSSNIFTNLFYFTIFGIVWVLMLGFGAPILIISGILFGQWLGTAISVLTLSIGALALYSIGNFFFRDLELRKPDYNLSIDVSSYGKEVADVIYKSEELFDKEKPDALIVLGDTYSGLSVMPAANKGIKIFMRNKELIGLLLKP